MALAQPLRNNTCIHYFLMPATLAKFTNKGWVSEWVLKDKEQSLQSKTVAFSSFIYPQWNCLSWTHFLRKVGFTFIQPHGSWVTCSRVCREHLLREGKALLTSLSLAKCSLPHFFNLATTSPHCLEECEQHKFSLFTVYSTFLEWASERALYQ